MWNPLKSSRRKLDVTPAEFSRLKPMRNPTVSWQKSGQHDVEITIPHPKSARGSLAARVFMIPEMKKYRLDEIGALVWILSDGEHTCKEIVEALCRRYKYVKREAELSLMSYMQTLSARNLVGFVKSRASEESETKSV